jgi:hypothetical protein
MPRGRWQVAHGVQLYDAGGGGREGGGHARAPQLAHFAAVSRVQRAGRAAPRCARRVAERGHRRGAAGAGPAEAVVPDERQGGQGAAGGFAGIHERDAVVDGPRGGGVSGGLYKGGKAAVDDHCGGLGGGGGGRRRRESGRVRSRSRGRGGGGGGGGYWGRRRGGSGFSGVSRHGREATRGGGRSARSACVAHVDGGG